MAAQGSDARVLVGHLRRPWGRRGELLIEVLTDWPELRFEAGGRVILRFRNGRLEEGFVEGFAPRAKGATIKLRGVDDIDQAEELREVELLVPREEAAGADDEEDSWHQADLIGAAVVLADDGRRVGRVRRVVEGGSSDLVEIALDGGGDALVPLVEQICIELDVAARVLTIDPPRGLIDPDEALVADPEER